MLHFNASSVLPCTFLEVASACKQIPPGSLEDSLTALTGFSVKLPANLRQLVVHVLHQMKMIHNKICTRLWERPANSSSCLELVKHTVYKP
ncbi:hypothetical protein CSA37_08870 [Candidatus Fermentibacteria bacterium]|nr:MAG: hypothetical protein CSA37_08870 [Candidatus Fermentibacteria bacterium]